jgi:hypothetical protein
MSMARALSFQGDQIVDFEDTLHPTQSLWIGGGNLVET